MIRRLISPEEILAESVALCDSNNASCGKITIINVTPMDGPDYVDVLQSEVNDNVGTTNVVVTIEFDHFDQIPFISVLSAAQQAMSFTDYIYRTYGLELTSDQTNSISETILDMSQHERVSSSLAMTVNIPNYQSTADTFLSRPDDIGYVLVEEVVPKLHYRVSFSASIQGMEQRVDMQYVRSALAEAMDTVQLQAQYQAPRNTVHFYDYGIRELAERIRRHLRIADKHCAVTIEVGQRLDEYDEVLFLYARLPGSTNEDRCIIGNIQR